jgi:hypothetical protein
MTIRISDRELEAISAYLDGQLSPREHARLESRLKTDSQLRLALEQMRRTRALLRSLPKVRAPRNYVLTPQMVHPRRQAPRSYPVLRLVATMASFLFVLVLIGDFLGLGRASSPQIAALTEEPMAQVLEAPSEEGDTSIESAAPAAEPEETQKGLAAEALPTATPAGTQGVVGLLASTPGPAELAAPQAAQPSAGLSAEAAASAQPAPGRQPTLILNPLRILEVILGLVAVLTGLAALIVRRAVSG